ncbi:MAG: PEP-CTERM sorting domain-containing protein [Planctomycetota bacterium]
MLRRLVFTFAVCGLASYASAGIAITSNGNLKLDAGGGAPNPSPIENMATINFASTDNLGGFVDQIQGGPAAVGNTIRSVTFGNVLGGTAIPGGNQSPLFVPGTTDLAGVITVLEGTITSVNPFGVIQATFTAGSAFVVDTNSPLGIFAALDGGTLDAATDILASYKLLSQIPVLSGAPFGAGVPPTGTPLLPASIVNTSSVNQGILPVSSSSLLFGELAGTTGNDFLDGVAPIVDPKGTEGLFVNASQFGSASNSDFAGPNQFAAYQDTINEFAALTDVGVFGAGPGGYNPNFVSGAFGPVSTTGDFFFTSNGGTADVIHTIVPEPASYAAFAILGLMAVRRRKKQAAA